MDIEKLLTLKHTSSIKKRKNKNRLTKKLFYKWAKENDKDISIICSVVGKYKSIKRTENGISYMHLLEDEWRLEETNLQDFWKNTRNIRDKFFIVKSSKY